MSDEVTAKESAAKIRLREEIQGVKTKSQRFKIVKKGIYYGKRIRTSRYINYHRKIG